MKNNLMAVVREDELKSLLSLHREQHSFPSLHLNMAWGRDCYMVEIDPSMKNRRYSLNGKHIIDRGEQYPLAVGDCLYPVSESGKVFWSRRIHILDPKEKILVFGQIYPTGEEVPRVLHAIELKARCPVVLKLKPVEGENSKRFYRAARNFGRLTNGITPALRRLGKITYKGITYDYQCFDYFCSQDLSQYLAAANRSTAEITAIFHQAASKVEQLHRMGLAHRNLLPEHLLINEEGEVRIVGLSLIKRENDIELTLSGGMPGNDHYCPSSVEDMFSRDIRTLAAIFVETITGSAVDFSEMAKYPALQKLPETLRHFLQRIFSGNLCSAGDLAQVFEQAHAFLRHKITSARQFLVAPGEEDIEPEGMLVKLWSRSFEEMGGDFYDLVALGEQKYGLVVGDSEGKGLDGSLISHVVQPTLHMLLKRNISCDYALQEVHNLLRRYQKSRHYFHSATVMCGIVDLAGHTFHFANAGHPLPVLCRDGQSRYLAPEDQVFLGNAIGYLPFFRSYQNFEQIKSGDLLFFYSDGLTEAIDSDNNLYQDRLLDALTGVKTAEEALSQIKKDLDQFRGQCSLPDDITAIAVEIL